MARIETGVDKLVELVGKEKKIELHEAAKRLGVDPAVVQEWAEFLEEEGIVSLQFSLSRTYVVEKRLNKNERQKKEKEYESKKEAFVRRVGSALKQLEDETAGFDAIKKQYDNVKQHIGDEIDAVKEEMEQLRHYEELKRSIDDDILKQKVDYQKKLDEIHSRIKSEERRFRKIAEQVDDEEKRLNQERTEFEDIRKEEQDLMKRIDALKDIVRSVHNRLETQEESIKSHEDRLKTLHDLAENLKDDIVEKRKKELDPLEKISEDQAKKILRIQDEIVEKVKAGRNKMQEFEGQSKEIAQQFEKFFKKRSRTEHVIRELDKAKHEMQDELNDLIRKAKAFEITSKTDTDKHIRELEGSFKEFDRRKNAFSRQLEYLKNVILGKDVKPPKGMPKVPAKKAAKKAAKTAKKAPRKKSKKSKKRAKKSGKKS